MAQASICNIHMVVSLSTSARWTARVEWMMYRNARPTHVAFAYRPGGYCAECHRDVRVLQAKRQQTSSTQLLHRTSRQVALRSRPFGLPNLSNFSGEAPATLREKRLDTIDPAPISSVPINAVCTELMTASKFDPWIITVAWFPKVSGQDRRETFESNSKSCIGNGRIRHWQPTAYLLSWGPLGDGKLEKYLS